MSQDAPKAMIRAVVRRVRVIKKYGYILVLVIGDARTIRGKSHRVRTIRGVFNGSAMR